VVGTIMVEVVGFEMIQGSVKNGVEGAKPEEGDVEAEER